MWAEYPYGFLTGSFSLKLKWPHSGGIQGARALNFFLAMVADGFYTVSKASGGWYTKKFAVAKITDEFTERKQCVWMFQAEEDVFGFLLFQLEFGVQFVWSFGLPLSDSEFTSQLFSVGLILPNRSNFFPYDQTVLMGLGWLILG